MEFIITIVLFISGILFLLIAPLVFILKFEKNSQDKLIQAFNKAFILTNKATSDQLGKMKLVKETPEYFLSIEGAETGRMNMPISSAGAVGPRIQKVRFNLARLEYKNFTLSPEQIAIIKKECHVPKKTYVKKTEIRYAMGYGYTQGGREKDIAGIQAILQLYKNIEQIALQKG